MNFTTDDELRARVRQALDDDPPALIVSPEEMAHLKIQRCPFFEKIAGPNPRQCQRPMHTEGPHRWVIELLELDPGKGD